MSIVRVGLAETKNFATGYDAIFGSKPSAKKKTATASNFPQLLQLAATALNFLLLPTTTAEASYTGYNFFSENQ